MNTERQRPQNTEQPREPHKSPLVRRADLILLICLLLAAVLIFAGFRLSAPHGAEAVVTVDGEELARLPLDRDTTGIVNGTHTVTVRDGSVSVDDAPCRDRICVHHPAVSQEGECIVCLPYKLVITVEGGGAHG